MSKKVRAGSGLLAVGGTVVLTMILFMIPEATGQDAGEGWKLEFDSDGKMKLPSLETVREWPFLGTPLTPNELNGGEAAFPEFHHVYMEPTAFAEYKKTGVFPEGTVIAKELVTVGKKKASSGRGFFEGEHNGFEIAHKSKKLYPKEPGSWAYYTFGHKPLPYNPTADKQPAASCADCHTALADEDMVFSQYYTNLRAAKPKK